MVLGVISSEPYALQSSDTFRDPHPHYLPPSVLFPHSLFQSRSLGCFTHSHCVESSVHSNYSTITSIIIIVILFSIQPTLLNCKAGEVLPWCMAILMTSAPIRNAKQSNGHMKPVAGSGASYFTEPDLKRPLKFF